MEHSSDSGHRQRLRRPTQPRRHAVNRSILALAAFMLPLGVLPAAAQPVAAKASYILTIGGINVAALEVNIEDSGSRYALDLSANVAGLGSLVASGTAKAKASGTSSGGGLVSESFALETRANGEVFNVDIGFANRNVASFKVDPPVLDSYDRVALERRHLTGVGDFLSAFVVKGGALDNKLCQRKMNIFTGVERLNIGMSFVKDDEATSSRTGYQGPLVLCQIDYQPVSGHYSSSEMTTYLDEVSRILIWYAPLEQTGYFIPYRVLLGTSMGDLSMVLVRTSS